MAQLNHKRFHNLINKEKFLPVFDYALCHEDKRAGSIENWYKHVGEDKKNLSQSKIKPQSSVFPTYVGHLAVPILLILGINVVAATSALVLNLSLWMCS